MKHKINITSLLVYAGGFFAGFGQVPETPLVTPADVARGPVVVPAEALLPPENPPASLPFLWARLTRDGDPTSDVALGAHEAAVAEARLAGTWDNPALGLEGENLGGDFSGTDEAEWTLALEQPVEWPGRRARKKQAAQLLVDEAELQVSAARRDVAIHFAREFYAALALQERVELYAEALEQANAFVAMAERRVELGSSTVLEVNKAKVEQAVSERAWARSKMELDLARKHLGSMVGVPIKGTLIGDLGDIPPAPDEAEVQRAMHATAAYALRGLAVQQRMLSVKDAERSWIPDITVGAGIRQNDAEEPQSFLGTVGITVPLWSRGGAERDAAIGRLQKARAEYALFEREVSGEIRARAASLSLLCTELEQLRETLIPLLETHAEQAESSYREGFIGYLEYLDAVSELRETNMQYVSLLEEYHVAYQDVQSLVDAPLNAAQE